MVQVTTPGVMKALTTCQEGEFCYVQSEEKMYRYNGDLWEEFEFPKGNLNMNLYDMNKSIMEQLPPMKSKDKQASREKFVEVARQGTYSMLLGRELGYYTVFRNTQIPTDENMIDVIFECLENLGTIKDISSTEDKAAVEIWIETDNGVTVLYFFNYDGGVIECSI